MLLLMVNVVEASRNWRSIPVRPSWPNQSKLGLTRGSVNWCEAHYHHHHQGSTTTTVVTKCDMCTPPWLPAATLLPGLSNADASHFVSQQTFSPLDHDHGDSDARCGLLVLFVYFTHYWSYPVGGGVRALATSLWVIDFEESTRHSFARAILDAVPCRLGSGCIHARAMRRKAGTGRGLQSFKHTKRETHGNHRCCGNHDHHLSWLENGCDKVYFEHWNFIGWNQYKSSRRCGVDVRDDNTNWAYKKEHTRKRSYRQQ